MAQVNLGTLIHGTMLNEDLLEAFADELERLIKEDAANIQTRNQESPVTGNEFAAQHAREHGGMQLVSDARTIDPEHEDATELVIELFDALDEYAPDYMYFGAHPDDGSDYGFWFYEGWEQEAKDDGVAFVSDLSEITPDVVDKDNPVVAVVNDHGNVSLYSVAFEPVTTKIWSVV